MPIYEFYCPRCQETFERILSMAAAEKGEQVECPKCGEKDVARVFSRFAVGTSTGPGGGCPPSSGPGCCSS